MSVADREADLYELFAAAARYGEVGVLVRSRHNRKSPEGIDLKQKLQGSRPCGRIEIGVPRKPGVAARTAVLEVRYAQVRIQPPRRCEGEELKLWAVEACEVGAKAQRIKWRLLTNMPVESLEEALEKIGWYRVRWQIEEYHRVLKSGCKVEARQLESAEALIHVLMVDMVVAWQVLSLSRAARLEKPQALEEHFSAEEIEVIEKYRARASSKAPAELSLREAVRWVARMGGFLGRKADGEPGAMTLWRGLEVLSRMVAGWQLAKTCG